ncbi:MAG TPA: hypothetical protein V6C90_21490 [Coleofasciculaceae cyanobacterium]
MSEADTPNNQPLPEPTASMDDSAADLPEATGTSENPPIVHLAKLPFLEDVVQQSSQEQTIELDSATTTSLTTVEVDDRTIEMPETTERQTKDADWFALAQKMRQRNHRLLDQVTDLKRALREKQEELHSELMRSQQRDTLLTQQAEELNTSQEQLTRLFHALESSHQAAQRQQILIETLSEQLQSSQERIAQLERECALTQQRYNEQSHQLLQAANTCRELRTRLNRQQRQTLQFKVALEKSLEMPTASSSVVQQQPHRGGTSNPSALPKAQPIQPWSAEPELDEETSSFDTLWKLPLVIEPLSAAYPSEVEPFEVRRPKETDIPSTVDASNPAETTIAKYSSVSGATPEELAAPLAKWGETQEQALLAASQESTDTELELEQQLLAEMTLLAEASGLSEVQSDLTDAQAPVTLEAETTNLDEWAASASAPGNTEKTQLQEKMGELDTEVQALREELWEDSDDPEPAQQNEVVLPQSNWPSPTLYPLRPPKKRKSLAAIDLPSFPRLRPS